MKRQRGQTTVFFALILTGLLLLTAVAVEIGRIVYARGEVGKAADAAALAAISRIDVATYRETGEIVFLPDVYATALKLCFDEFGVLTEATHRRGSDRDQRGSGDAGGVCDSIGGFIFTNTRSAAFSGNI